MPVVSHDWVATTASVKSWLPPETSDPSKIALYLSHDSVGGGLSLVFADFDGAQPGIARFDHLELGEN